jgi:hypothetical protein
MSNYVSCEICGKPLDEPLTVVCPNGCTDSDGADLTGWEAFWPRLLAEYEDVVSQHHPEESCH